MSMWRQCWVRMKRKKEKADRLRDFEKERIGWR
jgi:hypothetical protein